MLIFSCLHFSGWFVACGIILDFCQVTLFGFCYIFGAFTWLIGNVKPASVIHKVSVSWDGTEYSTETVQVTPLRRTLASSP